MAVATRVHDIPESATVFGFRISTFGTILGRSISLDDLQRLLAACRASGSNEDYRRAAEDDNVLQKPTASACRFGFRNLAEFYALDPKARLFRALRDLWDEDPSAQPLLALLCAGARDPILRALTPLVLALDQGGEITPDRITIEAERVFPDKFHGASGRSLGRNAASSWKQAGLLAGRATKRRCRATCRPTAVAYALLLGDLCGQRGGRLFDTIWTRMLDAPVHLLREHAAAASKQGWIEYRAAGDVTEVSFNHLMREPA